MKRLLLICITTLLAACSSVPTITGIQSTVPVSVETSAFELQGRLGVKHEKGGQHGNVSWRHLPASDDVEMRSPLGSIVAKLQVNAQGASIDFGDGHIQHASTIESLSKELLGWELPLTGLRYWVLAQPIPDAPSQSQKDSQGRIIQLNQNGWVIVYTNYPDNNSLPGKIIMRRKLLEIRLVVDTWSISNAELSSTRF
ncbi:lipoprotein insertase outer membrane protein LolB [Chitinivorax sp. B]|uniref:lipoprotein insertase outer membrane protein LolB n=1 Tax=Chitinivorax sp. B TaxID=2502235 RepID=UPI0010F9B6CD|nr:lipoprotein insertase outer membrane protein LolB [Chitinivorax sp. B]